jgi:hypothetical protein
MALSVGWSLAATISAPSATRAAGHEIASGVLADLDGALGGASETDSRVLARTGLAGGDAIADGAGAEGKSEAAGGDGTGTVRMTGSVRGTGARVGASELVTGSVMGPVSSMLGLLDELADGVAAGSGASASSWGADAPSSWARSFRPMPSMVGARRVGVGNAGRGVGTTRSSASGATTAVGSNATAAGLGLSTTLALAWTGAAAGVVSTRGAKTGFG